MSRPTPFRPSVGLLLFGLGTAAVAAASCSSAPPEPGFALPPAGPSARAEARRQREMRREALEELQDDPNKEDKAKSAAPPKAMAEPSEPEATGEGGAGGGGEGGAGGAGGGGEGGASNDTANEEVDASTLCGQLCERVVSCAKEKMPPELQGNASSMLDSMAASCRNRCVEEAEKATSDHVAKAKGCLDDSCDEFMDCVSDLL